MLATFQLSLGAECHEQVHSGASLATGVCELPSYFWPPPTAFCSLPTAYLQARSAGQVIRTKAPPATFLRMPQQVAL
jgi:hypothetical protein